MFDSAPGRGAVGVAWCLFGLADNILAYSLWLMLPSPSVLTGDPSDWPWQWP